MIATKSLAIHHVMLMLLNCTIVSLQLKYFIFCFFRNFLDEQERNLDYCSDYEISW